MKHVKSYRNHYHSFKKYCGLYLCFVYYTEDDVDIGPLDNMDTEKRNKLFERGINFDKEGKKTAALKCYMGCLQGLQHDTKFPLLPVCLRNVSLQGDTKFPLLPVCLRNVSLQGDTKFPLLPVCLRNVSVQCDTKFKLLPVF